MKDASERLPFFSVVVPVLNGGEVFRDSLEALRRSSFGDFELWVVDDGSTDDSRATAEKSGARRLQTRGRQGPAAARNLGARRARGEFLLFLDADCSVGPETLRRAAAILSDDETLDALFGSYDDEPAAPGWVAQYKNLQHHWVHQRGDPEASTFWAGCGAVRRQVFLDLGGFDEARFSRPAIEDIELGYRLRRSGRRIRLARDVQVKHHKAWSLWSVIRSDLLDRGIPWSELLAGREGPANELNLGWIGRLSVVSVVLLVASLFLALVEPLWALLAGVTMVALLWFNREFYGFLSSKRGAAFLLAAVPLHWLYYLNCAIAYPIGHLRHWWRALTQKASGES
jgi:glycosyltransferase involved in cell wall biosynthesis